MALIARKHKVLIGEAKSRMNDVFENIEAAADEDSLNLYLASREYQDTVNMAEEVIPSWLEGGWTPSLGERITEKRKELRNGYYG